jgi:hypothetical protein
VSEYDQNLWKAVKVLAGGREWGCVNEQNKPSVILRNVVGLEVIDQHTLVLDTIEANYAVCIIFFLAFYIFMSSISNYKPSTLSRH